MLDSFVNCVVSFSFTTRRRVRAWSTMVLAGGVARPIQSQVGAYSEFQIDEIKWLQPSEMKSSMSYIMLGEANQSSDRIRYLTLQIRLSTLEPFVMYVYPSTFTVGSTNSLSLSSPSTQTIEPGGNRFRFTGRDDHRLIGESNSRSSLRGSVFAVSSSLSLVE